MATRLSSLVGGGEGHPHWRLVYRVLHVGVAFIGMLVSLTGDSFIESCKWVWGGGVMGMLVSLVL